MSVVHYESGVFSAWIDGVLTPISVSDKPNSGLGLNSPLAMDGEDGDDNFYPFMMDKLSSPEVLLKLGGPFTAGSVIFSNGSFLAQDNANLFWNDSLNRWGIGTNVPEDKLEVRSSTATWITGANQIGRRNSNDIGSAGFNFQKGRGTLAVPTASAAGDQLGYFAFNGYTDGWKAAAAIVGYAATGWGASGDDSPGELAFITTSDGTQDFQERMRLDARGNLRFGDYSVPFPTTGTSSLVFYDGIAPSGMGSNTAGIYSDDVSGTVRMHAIDEAGAAGPIAVLNYANIFTANQRINAILSINTGVLTSAVAGDIVLQNNRSVRVVNNAGSNTISMFGVDTTDYIVMNPLGDSARLYLNSQQRTYIPEIAAASFFAGGLAANGCIGIDTTNNRLVIYSGTNRYYITPDGTF